MASFLTQGFAGGCVTQLAICLFEMDAFRSDIQKFNVKHLHFTHKIF